MVRLGRFDPSRSSRLFRAEPKTGHALGRGGQALSTIRTLGGHRRFHAREIRKILWTPGSEFANQPQPVHRPGAIWSE
jgi:hypothetical protein